MGRKQHRTSELGYCKPPQEHRFKKGVSGNPSGRRKSRSMFGDPALSVALVLADVARESNSPKQRGTSAIAHHFAGRLVGDALKGNSKARKHLWELMPQIERSLQRRQDIRNDEEMRKRGEMIQDIIDSLDRLRVTSQ